MIDKARAREAGLNGPYIYPCPLDKTLLSFLDVSDQDFAYAAKSRTDALILEWLAIHARPRSKKQIEIWNKQMLERGLKMRRSGRISRKRVTPSIRHVRIS